MTDNPWVAATDLEVGHAPAGGDDTVRVTPGPLPAGTPAWVLGESADGDWLLVAAPLARAEEAMPLGWVPAVVDGRPSLEPMRLACPASPIGVEALVALGRLGPLACYGDQPIELVGFTPTGCGAGGSPRSGTPEWLNGTWSGLGIGAAEPAPPDFEVAAEVRARIAPEATFEAGCGAPGWFRFTGRFDHPAAETCRTTLDDGSRPIVIEPRLSILLCRTELVLTNAERLAVAP